MQGYLIFSLIIFHFTFNKNVQQTIIRIVKRFYNDSAYLSCSMKILDNTMDSSI